MKIVVKRSFPIVFSLLVHSVQRAAVIFVVAVIGLSIVLNTALQIDAQAVRPVAIGISTLAAVAFLLSKIIEGVLHAKGTELEVTPQQLSGVISGFSSNSFTLPLSKVGTLYVYQNFVDKLFGICAVVYTQMNATMTVYGFDIKDAQALIKKCAEYQSKK